MALPLLSPHQVFEPAELEHQGVNIQVTARLNQYTELHCRVWQGLPAGGKQHEEHAQALVVWFGTSRLIFAQQSISNTTYFYAWSGVVIPRGLEMCGLKYKRLCQQK